jgi:hypothetical protein
VKRVTVAVPFLFLLLLPGCFEEATSTSDVPPGGNDVVTPPGDGDLVDAIVRYCVYAQMEVVGTRGDLQDGIGPCIREVASDLLHRGWDGLLNAELERVVRCAADGASQAAFTECATRGRAAQCHDSNRTACDGNFLVNERWGYCQVLDCTTNGEQCLGGTDHNDPSIMACTTGEACTGTYRCDGRKVVGCANGLGTVRSLCPADQQCTGYDDGSMACATEPCTGEARSCKGNVLTWCGPSSDGQSKNRNLYTVDCASTGLLCVQDGGFGGYGKPACNVPDDGECAAFTGNLCDGTKIAACVRAKIAWLDCTDYGMTKCVSYGAANARCEP